MIKIPVVFMKDPKNPARVIDDVNQLCAWVLAGEGVATRKLDGTAVLVREGLLYARYDAKRGKAPPVGALPCTEEPDPTTGHWPHWVLATRPEDRWIREAHEHLCNSLGHVAQDGTYEAVGLAINGNPEGLGRHMLFRHGAQTVVNVVRTFDGIRAALTDLPWEGIVFHHPDGRMAKIRRRDYGLQWPIKAGAL